MQLLEHFKTLTLHPKNAQELKGLILQLAVQGKLTQQWRQENPDVESASELLERIQAEKVKLVKEKKIKKDRTLFEISENEIPYELPESWVWCKLGDLNQDIHYGYTASALHTFEGIRMLRITDIQNNKVNWDRVPDCNIKENDIPRYKLEENDILIARTGGTIGKSYQVKGVNVNSVFASYLIRAIPMEQVFPEYIKLWLESPIYWKQLVENSQGTGQPNVNATALKGLSVSLPPLEEQNAIVEVVNQLFAEVEQVEDLTKKRIQLKADYVTSALQQLTQAAEQDTTAEWNILQKQFGTFFTEKVNIKKLRESILQLAVQGKLTRDWRSSITQKGVEVEPAATLLERIKAEKAQLVKAGKIKKEKPLPEITEEEIPYELPEGWAWCKWVDLLGSVNYPMKRGPFGSSLRKDDFVEIGIRVFEQYNPINDDPNWMRYFITDEKYEAGDFLVSCSGATLGRIVYLPEGTIPGIINQALLKLTLSQDVILSDYFLKLFRSYYIQEQIWQKAQGMAQPNMVGVKELKNILIPLPPIEEQKAIVEKVNALMSFCDKLEEEIEIHKITQEQWMQSCLKEVLEPREMEVIE